MLSPIIGYSGPLTYSFNVEDILKEEFHKVLVYCILYNLSVTIGQWRRISEDLLGDVMSYNTINKSEQLKTTMIVVFIEKYWLYYAFKCCRSGSGRIRIIFRIGINASHMKKLIFFHKISINLKLWHLWNWWER